MKFRHGMFVVALVAGTWAAQADEGSGKHYSVGAAAGMTGGSGVSVRIPLNPQSDLQLNFLPYYSEKRYPKDDDGFSTATRDSGYANFGIVNLGALYQRRLADLDPFRVFAYGGGNYMGVYHKEDYYYSDYSESGRETRNYLRSLLTAGAGLGGGIRAWRFEATAMLGFLVVRDFHDETTNLVPSIDVALHFEL